MAELLTLLLAIVLANNLVLSHLVGVEALVGGDADGFDRQIALGVFTTVAMCVVAAFCWPIEHFVLKPLALSFLRTPILILVVALALGLMHGLVARFLPTLREIWLSLRWLVAANSAVLGVGLVVLRDARDFASAIVLGFGGGLAYTLVLLLFAGLRSRLAQAEVPAAFRGAPIELLTAALMALAFLGLSGLERHV